MPKDKQVIGFEFDGNFPRVGWRKLRLDARSFFQEGRGLQLILLALEDVSGGKNVGE